MCFDAVYKISSELFLSYLNEYNELMFYMYRF
jgi:hypothetical protein